MQGKMVAVLIWLGRGTENLREPVWLIWDCERHLRWFGVNARNCWLPLESRWSGKRRRAKRLQPSKSVLYHLAHLCLESMSSNPLREFMRTIVRGSQARRSLFFRFGPRPARHTKGIRYRTGKR